MRAPILCSACSAAPAVVRELRLCLCAACVEPVRHALLGPARAWYPESRPTLDDVEQIQPVEAR